MFHFLPPPVCSENAEIIGQHLTLPRWIQILSARLKGLKSLSQGNGKSFNCQSTVHAAPASINLSKNAQPPIFSELSDCNTQDGVDGDLGLCGEGQPDFRSILSYGVQEPWVKAVIPYVSVTQQALFLAVRHPPELCCLQEEVLKQHRGDVGCVRHHRPPGGAADGTQWAVPKGAPDGLEHMCLHDPGHR